MDLFLHFTVIHGFKKCDTKKKCKYLKCRRSIRIIVVVFVSVYVFLFSLLGQLFHSNGQFVIVHLEHSSNLSTERSLTVEL